MVSCQGIYTLADDRRGRGRQVGRRRRELFLWRLGQGPGKTILRCGSGAGRGGEAEFEWVEIGYLWRSGKTAGSEKVEGGMGDERKLNYGEQGWK